MAFKKGDKKPETSGRQKQVPNKVTQTAREIFIATLEAQSDRIGKAFDDVLMGKKDENDNYITKPDPAKYLELFAKYAQYFVPKKLDVNMEGKVITVIPPNKK